MDAANDPIYENTMEMALLPGQSMTLELAERPDVGYLWRMARGPSRGIRATLARAPAPPILPEGGKVVALLPARPTRATLTLVAPAQPDLAPDDIELVLERTFDPGADPLQRLVLRLTVSGI